MSGQGPEGEKISVSAPAERAWGFRRIKEVVLPGRADDAIEVTVGPISEVYGLQGRIESTRTDHVLRYEPGPNGPRLIEESRRAEILQQDGRDAAALADEARLPLALVMSW